MSGVAVIGAGIAGVRAAESLSAAGYLGQITILGDESPIYRPSVSKEALAVSSTGSFPMPLKQSDSHFTWKLGSTVRQVNLAQQSLQFIDADGATGELLYEGLILAPGLRPRTLPIAGPTRGRYLLRSLAQAAALADQLRPGARVSIIGSGFIGCEVAAAAAVRGCQVTVISPEPLPLASALGETIATIVNQRHREHGVRFIYEQSVLEYRGDTQIREVLLSDGTALHTDLVLEAVGSIPNIDCLNGQGLQTSNGLLVDHHLRVSDAHGAVFACGDIAQHPNALFGSDARRVEHWTVAADMGTYAGRAMQALLSTGYLELPAFAAVPSFWSDQYDLQIQSFGIPELAIEHTVLEMTDEGACIIECRDSIGLVAVIGINRTAELARYRKTFNSRILSTGLLSENAEPH
ncbi:MAG: FAD-dependent oxidoreductase [Actinomycetota bacterium]|nr:FAD-dependent oxidoreductase [Actinomycetota bacterium]MDP2287011.1 FAD-dependent oxidoreductase [Actinomycetota bacterium]